MMFSTCGDRKKPLLFQVRAQTEPVHEFHHDERDILGLAVVEHADDVRVREPPRGARVPLEAAQILTRFGVGAIGEKNGLDRNLAGDGYVAAFVDSAHRTPRKHGPKLVFAKRRNH
jgi:hypothetical protein